MGHYDEQYEERDKKEHERKKSAEQSRKIMMDIPPNDMIKIMFNHYLRNLSDFDAIQLSLVNHNSGRRTTYL